MSAISVFLVAFSRANIWLVDVVTSVADSLQDDEILLDAPLRCADFCPPAFGWSGCSDNLSLFPPIDKNENGKSKLPNKKITLV